MKNRMSKKHIALCVMVTMLCLLLGVGALAESVSTSVADRQTIDDWRTMFGSANAPTTQYAGAIWVDKSVFTASEAKGYFGNNMTIGNDQFGNENFLVSLSAIGSNSEVLGYSTIPTDTMIVLDLSSSMYGSSLSPTSINNMVQAVNETIVKLQNLNKYNRVGVTTYFGGNNVDNDLSTVAASHLLMLPLGRYTHANNKFLSTTVSNGKLQSVQVNSNVKIEGKKNNVAQAKRSVVSGGKYLIAGTYMQLGILSALDQFMDANTEIEEGIQKGQERMPIMILMSDGEPTAGNAKFTEMVTSEMGNNRVADRNPAQTDFVTQLTAAYARMKMDEHYVTTEPLFYTLSLGNSISLQVMDPKNNMGDSAPNASQIKGYWTKLINSGSVRLDYYNYSPRQNVSTTVSKVTENGKTFPTDTDQMYYVDQMFTATTSGQLTDAFDAVVQEIKLRSRYYGTLISSGDIHTDGYVEFADEIGGFMEVKNVKGLYYKTETGTPILLTGSQFADYIVNDKLNAAQQSAIYAALQKRLNINANQLNALLNNAKQKGQLAYTNENVFSNHLAWYADANVKYLAPYSEGTSHGSATYIVRSYVYMGRAQGVVYEDSDSDWFYALVRVRENIKTGTQIVEYKLPASLLPLVTYTITMKEEKTEIADGNVAQLSSDVAEKYPVCLLYEVGLDAELKGHTLVEQVSDIGGYGVNYERQKDGSYYFYTNRWREWDAQNKKYVSFKPPMSMSGDIHTSAGSEYTTVATLTPSKQNELYHFVTDTVVYKNEEPYRGTDKPSGAGYQYRHVYVYKEGGQIKVVDHFDAINEKTLTKAVRSGSNWIIPAGTPHLNMELFEADKDANKTDTLDYADAPLIMQDSDGTFHAYSFQGNNGRIHVKPQSGLKISKTLTAHSLDPNANQTFTFNVSLPNGIYSTIMVDADGNETSGSVTVTNGEGQVTLNAGETIYILGLPGSTNYTVEEEAHNFYAQTVPANGKPATGEIVDNSIDSVEFVNAPMQFGNLLVTKDVTYTGLENLTNALKNKKFDVTITLTGERASESSDESNEVRFNRTQSADGKTVTYTGTLSDDQAYLIEHIPAGVEYTVDENLGNLAYFTKDIVYPNTTHAIEANAQAQVSIINRYTPSPVGPQLVIKGTKTLESFDENPVHWPDEGFTLLLQQVQTGGTSEAPIGAPIKVTTLQDPTNTENGNKQQTYQIDLSDISYNKTGTYTYKLYEEVPGTNPDNNIFYDTSFALFSVMVADENADGALEIKDIVVHQNSAAIAFGTDNVTTITKNFENNYRAGHVSFTVHKKVVDADKEPISGYSAGILFGLYESETADNYEYAVLSGANGEATFEIPLKQSDFANLKDYKKTYYLREIIPTTDLSVPGMTYDTAWKYEIDIAWPASENEPNLTIRKYGTQETVSQMAEIVNEFNLPDKVKINLSGKKSMQGKQLEANDFVFGLYKTGADFAVNGYSNPTYYTTHNAAGEFAFTNIPVDEVGTHYMLVHEIPGYTIADGELVQKNRGGVIYSGDFYHVTVNVVKHLEGNTAKLSINEEDGGYVRVVKVGSGAVSTNELNFTNYYQIKDEEEVTISGTKTLEGRDMIPGEFTFKLYAADADYNYDSAAEALGTATNGYGGEFAFAPITYNAPGTFYYAVVEEIGNKGGVTYDETKFGVKVVVEDDGNGNLNPPVITRAGAGADKIQFTNQYEATDAELTLSGTKYLDGRQLNAGDFTFELFETNESFAVTDEKPIQTAKNDAQGHYSFDLTYTQAQLAKKVDYYYVVREKKDSRVDGVFFDYKDYHVHVVVMDDGAGHLFTRTTIYESGGADDVQPNKLDFYNSYVPNGIFSKLPGGKTLAGAVMVGGEFFFELYKADKDFTLIGSPMETVTNDAGGSFAFNVELKDIGENYFVVLERAGNDPLMIYDETVYHVVIETQSDTETGVLSQKGEAKITIAQTGKDAEGIAFANTYIPDVNLPETGDGSTLLAWLGLLGLTGVLLILRKKRTDA